MGGRGGDYRKSCGGSRVFGDFPFDGGSRERSLLLWILGALNLLPGAGYFLFSGIFRFGDWNEVISGLPHHAALRIGMSALGAGLYVMVAWRIGVMVRPFVPDGPTYNVVGRLPYFAACLFSCAAGALDPLGFKLLLVSTVPAAFGG